MPYIESGYGVQPPEWHVDEPSAAGYSRVYYITGGETTYCDSDQTRRLAHGKLYIFPSYAPFRMSHEPSDPLVCLWYHFDLFPAFVSRLAELDVKPDGSLFHIVSALMREQNSGDKGSAVETSLADALEEYILERGGIPHIDGELAEILRRLRASYSDTCVTVSGLARELNYAESYFIRYFKTKIGITPYQYITNLRMSAAVRLLMSDMPVGAVAGTSGYSESKVFSRAFTQKYGISPSAYKKYFSNRA